jgi:hypothetical protein
VLPSCPCVPHQDSGASGLIIDAFKTGVQLTRESRQFIVANAYRDAKKALLAFGEIARVAPLGSENGRRALTALTGVIVTIREAY